MALRIWEGADAGLEPVTVADEIKLTGRPALRCPAGVLLAGELRARGIPVTRGPVLAGQSPVPAGTQPRRIVLGAELGPGFGLAVAVAGPWEAQVRPVLNDWLSAAGDRTILLPSPRSFCAGVERAIKAVEQALTQHEGPVYVRRQVVHNKTVVADLESRGAIFVEELDQVPRGATVVFSAHGVAPSVRRDASDRDLAVIDTTCPLVRKIHAEARRFA